MTDALDRFGAVIDQNIFQSLVFDNLILGRQF
jgi:hypothetical protein